MTLSLAFILGLIVGAAILSIVQILRIAVDLGDRARALDASEVAFYREILREARTRSRLHPDAPPAATTGVLILDALDNGNRETFVAMAPSDLEELVDRFELLANLPRP